MQYITVGAYRSCFLAAVIKETVSVSDGPCSLCARPDWLSCAHVHMHTCVLSPAQCKCKAGKETPEQRKD